MARSWRRRLAAAAMGVLWAAGGTGCLARTTVVRVEDGREYDGRFVTPESYATTMEAGLAEAAGKRDAARALYERAVSVDPKNVTAWSRLGALSCATDRKKAESAIGRALDLDPDGFDGWLARAQCELWHREWVPALASARRAVAASPGSREASFLCAVAESRIGKPEESRRWLTAFALFAPNAPTNLREADVGLDSALMSGDAASAKRAALAAHIPDPELARAAVEHGRLALARETVDRAQAADPNDGDGWVVAATVADLQGDTERFDDLLRRAPHSPSPVGPETRRLLLELMERKTLAREHAPSP